ncbi:hypothetical protein I8H89_01740 [Candidatus Saccharibacteria bacterium]|nr:hypothetical protein [Candidatus Saccharibacteria bacterium]
MSDKNITVVSGSAFIDVCIEIADECEHLEEALNTGIAEALHTLNHVIPPFIDQADSDTDSLGRIAMTPTTINIGGIACSVRVSGRINGVPAYCMNDLFDLIADEVLDATARATLGPSKFNSTDAVALGDLLGEFFSQKSMTDRMGSSDLGYRSTVFGESSDSYSSGFGRV